MEELDIYSSTIEENSIQNKIEENDVYNKIEECQELKNIKYKTMLLNGNPIQETKSSNDLSNLEKFLENEKNNNQNEPWCKLNKTIKTRKLIDFVEVYKNDKKLDKEESELLLIFLKDSLDRKKLQRVKDVIYDKIIGTIKEIPALHYIKNSKRFTLKNIDKRISTVKSLSVKKSNGTIKNTLTNIVKQENDSSCSDNEI
uniref:Uncharacterized protein n=1 Tax=viral metagenome TaxID=1070528 RepID=A0A6C0ERU3_9ZZZZ